MTTRTPLNILLVVSGNEPADVARLLAGDGHAVSRAGSLAEAEELCEIGRFDLMIVNHRLPDGPACELLAGAGACRHVPGIVMAADDDDLCSVSLGFRARLAAPVALPALRTAIVLATASGR